MRSVPLGEIAKIVRGVTFKPTDVIAAPDESDLRCMRTKNVQIELDESDIWAIPTSALKRDEQVLQEGDLLVSSANSWNLVGKACWVPKLAHRSTFGGFVSAIRPDRRLVDDRYLFRFVTSQRTQATVRSYARQTTNIANLDLKRLAALSVPLPPLSEQRRIAAILDHADTLRTKRRKSTEQLNEFSKAVFVDMFGDPVTNPLAWELKPLGQFGILDRGVSRHRPRNDPALLGGPYQLVQTGEVANSGGYIRQTEQSYSELGLKQSKLWPSGTLCITIAANIAKTGILKFDACFPDSVVGFKPITDPIDSEYVRVWLTFLQSTLEASAPESAQKNINLAILRALPIPVPPVELRRRFDARLQHLNRVADQASESASTLDALFSSLQSRAFRGEL